MQEWTAGWCYIITDDPLIRLKKTTSYIHNATCSHCCNTLASAMRLFLAFQLHNFKLLRLCSWEWNQIRYAGCQLNAPDRNGVFSNNLHATCQTMMSSMKIRSCTFATSKSSPLLSLPSLETSIDKNSGSEIKTLVSFLNLKVVNFYSP